MSLDKFKHYLQYEKRYSKHTLTSYETDLRQFQHFLSQAYEITEWNEVQPSFIRSWIVELMESNIGPRSINRKISSLQTFFKFCLKQELLQTNPAANITKPKVPKKLPVYLEEDQTEMLVSADFFEDSFKGKRDQLIIELLYTTGMRLSELIHIKIQDIDFYRGEIKVIGKRNKERIIPVSKEVLTLITIYNKKKESEGISFSEAFLLSTHKGLKVYPKLVYRTVNNYISKVSSLKKKSPHVLRHTFATQMLNRGADLNAIKEILGHASLAATQVYTHNSISKLKDIHQTAHPKG